MFTGTLREFQKPAVKKMVDRGSVLVAYDMGLGKALRNGTPVLTPDGWRNIEDLVVGDEVMGSDGCPTEVLGVYPQPRRAMYRVTFSDGAWVDCDSEHLWAVNTPVRNKRGNPHKVMSLGEIQTGLHDKAGNRRHFVPIVSPVEHPYNSYLPLDPYLLGVLLGDGCFKKNSVLLSSADESLIAEVGTLLPVGMSLNYAGQYDYRVAYKKGHRNPVLEAVRALGLAERKSWSKFVPAQYLMASSSQRLSMLQGLLDTDGHVRPLDGCVEFCSTSEQMAQDVVALVQSLGGVARINHRLTTHRDAWVVIVAMPADLVPFRLPRKIADYRPRTKYHPARAIASVHYVDYDLATCIAVDAEDRLYVIKDYLVTHNTVLSIAAVEELLDTEQVRGGLIIAGASLKYQWAKEIAKFTDGAKVLVIDGTPAQRLEQYAIAHRYEYVIMTYDTVVNDWQSVRRLERDFVVLDEAVAIKGFTTNRTRTVKKLSAPFRYALTGQPVENRPEEVFSIMEWVDDEVLGSFEFFDRTFIKRNEWGGVQHYRNLPALHERLSEAMVRKKRTDPDVAAEMPDVVEETIYIRMDPAGRSLYNAIREDLQIELAAAMRGSSWDIMAHYGMGDSGDNNAQRGRIMSRLTCLRMLCVHPELLRISAGKYGDRFVPDSDGILAGSEYAFALKEGGDLDKNLGTPKITALMEELELILDEDPRNKVVVFSFFLNMLDLVKGAVANHKTLSKMTNSVIFDGTMSSKAREAAKEKFQTDPKVRLFLSSDAGGVGVDLPQANYLISLDLPWSAGKMDQRNARIIRLSSEWEKVTLLNFLVKGSIEERQYSMLEQKRAIASAIVDGYGIDVQGKLELSLSSLSEFLEDGSL